MGRFLTRRLLAAVLLLLGITLVTFLLTNVVPGDPAAANLGQRAIEDPEAVAAFNHRYGLDKPLPVQYFTYLGNLAQGDLGDSQQSRRPVREDLAEFAPATLELAGTAIAISMVVGVGARHVGGVPARPAGRLDRCGSSRSPASRSPSSGCR